MGEDEFPQMPTINASAVALHELFTGLVEAGFKRREAIEIVKANVHGAQMGATFAEVYATMNMED